MFYEKCSWFHVRKRRQRAYFLSPNGWNAQYIVDGMQGSAWCEGGVTLRLPGHKSVTSDSVGPQIDGGHRSTVPPADGCTQPAWMRRISPGSVHRTDRCVFQRWRNVLFHRQKNVSLCFNLSSSSRRREWNPLSDSDDVMGETSIVGQTPRCSVYFRVLLKILTGLSWTEAGFSSGACHWTCVL